MKVFRLLLVVVFCGTLVSSCFDPPEYPDSPEISFESVAFVKGGPLPNGGGVGADSIVLVLNFKDGDGDIGISADEVAPPFNDRWYYLREPLQHDGSLVDDCTSYNLRCWGLNPIVTEFDKYIDYNDRSSAEYDTLKPYIKPYNCINWDVIKEQDDNDPNTPPPKTIDTLFFTLNPHYNNLFVEFQTKTATGYEIFDEKQFFNAPLCGIRPFNGRIPILSEDLGSDTPLEGVIRYRIPSVSFQTIFGAKTLRLRVYIEDRALHKSNEIFTRDFTLLEN